jgi:hypothetical protein
VPEHWGLTAREMGRIERRWRSWTSAVARDRPSADGDDQPGALDRLSLAPAALQALQARGVFYGWAVAAVATLALVLEAPVADVAIAVNLQVRRRARRARARRRWARARRRRVRVRCSEGVAARLGRSHAPPPPPCGALASPAAPRDLLSGGSARPATPPPRLCARAALSPPVPLICNPPPPQSRAQAVGASLRCDEADLARALALAHLFAGLAAPLGPVATGRLAPGAAACACACALAVGLWIASRAQSLGALGFGVALSKLAGQGVLSPLAMNSLHGWWRARRRVVDTGARARARGPRRRRGCERAGVGAGRRFKFVGRDRARSVVPSPRVALARPGSAAARPAPPLTRARSLHASAL